MRSVGISEVIVAAFIVGLLFIISIVPFCKISERLGFSKWWGLLVLIPFGTGMMIWAYYVAFSKWPDKPSPQ
jgi:hypothetical protein